MDVAPTLFDEITDFLVSSPTPHEIIEFQPSSTLNERLHELLDKNSRDKIASDERMELESFVQMGHILSMLKAKARLKLREQS